MCCVLFARLYVYVSAIFTGTLLYVYVQICKMCGLYVYVQFYIVCAEKNFTGLCVGFYCMCISTKIFKAGIICVCVLVKLYRGGVLVGSYVLDAF